MISTDIISLNGNTYVEPASDDDDDGAASISMSGEVIYKSSF